MISIYSEGSRLARKRNANPDAVKIKKQIKSTGTTLRQTAGVEACCHAASVQ